MVLCGDQFRRLPEPKSGSWEVTQPFINSYKLRSGSLHCMSEPTTRSWDDTAQVETDPSTGVPFLDDKNHSRMWAISPFQSKARANNMACTRFA